MADYTMPPTDEQVLTAFREFVAERSAAGVMLAQSVADIRFSGGTITVALDPALSGAQYWALMETSPYDNHAELFGSPVADHPEPGPWLRQRVAQVEVVDIDGRPLGTLTSADLHRRALGR